MLYRSLKHTECVDVYYALKEKILVWPSGKEIAREIDTFMMSLSANPSRLRDVTFVACSTCGVALNEMRAALPACSYVPES